MPYANFSGVICRPAAFIGCVLENGMFLESALSGAVLRIVISPAAILAYAVGWESISPPTGLRDCC